MNFIKIAVCSIIVACLALATVGCGAPNSGAKDVIGPAAYKAHQARKDAHEDKK
jgi:hypothetical protein